MRQWHVLIRAHDPSVGFDEEGEPRRGFWTYRHVEANSGLEAGQAAVRKVLLEDGWHVVVNAEWGADPVAEAREVDEVENRDCDRLPLLGLSFFEESEGPTRYYVRRDEE